MCVCVCVCVCVRARARARMHMKGDCRNLKCNPPLENPAYGPVNPHPQIRNDVARSGTRTGEIQLHLSRGSQRPDQEVSVHFCHPCLHTSLLYSFAFSDVQSISPCAPTE